MVFCTVYMARYLPLPSPSPRTLHSPPMSLSNRDDCVPGRLPPQLRSVAAGTNSGDDGGGDDLTSTTTADSWNDVDQWLRSLQLAHYSAHFRRAGFSSLDTIRCSAISVDDLTRIGITSPDHRQILLDAIRRLDSY